MRRNIYKAVIIFLCLIKISHLYGKKGKAVNNQTACRRSVICNKQYFKCIIVFASLFVEFACLKKRVDIMNLSEVHVIKLGKCLLDFAGVHHILDLFYFVFILFSCCSHFLVKYCSKTIFCFTIVYYNLFLFFFLY